MKLLFMLMCTAISLIVYVKLDKCTDTMQSDVINMIENHINEFPSEVEVLDHGFNNYYTLQLIETINRTKCSYE